MKLNDAVELIQNGESEVLEFKKSSANLKSAAETLCAFLNAKGGIVLLGVSNNQEIVGQDVTDQTKQEIANTLRKFEPTANVEVQYLSTENGKELIVLTAYPDYRSVPYTFDGRAYERKESSTSIMPQTKYQQLLLSRNLNPASWESQVAIDMSIDDLDHHEIV